MEGGKDILGIWIGEHESSKFWLNVLTELKSRGVKDVYLFCVDGLTGFREVIEAVYPKAGIQRCIIHQIRYSIRFVSHKDIKALMADLKLVYTAVTEDEALNNLIRFKEKWSKCISPFSCRKPSLNIRTMSERKFYLHKIRRGAFIYIAEEFGGFGVNLIQKKYFIVYYITVLRFLVHSFDE